MLLVLEKLMNVINLGLRVELVGVDLQWAWATKDQNHLSTLIGGNPLNQGAVGPIASAYIMGM
jgi:hypothetical protein